ncbi:MAG TPA: peptidylprolyl isomerase [Steroidobacteraceae bacterium]|nr:peptidylprolyl isomerase [Steroidobacteraceae bacterium]
MRIAVPRGAATLVAALLAGAAQAQGTPTAGATAPVQPARTMSDVLAATTAADWRPLEPENTLYVQLPSGQVVIELAPAFAPRHAANLRTLVREKYFDGLAVIRSQDNFVVQWGDAAGKRALGHAQARLPPEFTARVGPGLPFEPIPDRDGYAPEVGFSQGFPAARDPARGEAWLTHCYGMVGAGRGNETDSGNGAELYVVTGHAPRQLDRNIALVGRVVQGMERLSTLPRGSGPLGFYEQPGQHVPIASIRLAADVPAVERVPLEVMRTDTASFRALVEARRNRRDDWYRVPAGYIDVCNVPIVARTPP